MIISDFPVMASSPGSFPRFNYTGEYTVIDDGSENGMKQVALLTSGTLTLLEDADSMSITARGGGGGGGAGYSSYTGSDGSDGSIETLTVSLRAGVYIVTIGAAGVGGNNGAGSAGGETSFGNLLIAEGGAGGKRVAGVNVSHTTLYSMCGCGGEGGTSDEYTGDISPGYYYIMVNPGAPIYTEPDKTSEIDRYAPSYDTAWKFSLGYNTPIRYTDADGNWYYKIEVYGFNDGYVCTSDCTTSSPLWYPESDSRVWYGHDGNPGIVVLSGKV